MFGKKGIHTGPALNENPPPNKSIEPDSINTDNEESPSENSEEALSATQDFSSSDDSAPPLERPLYTYDEDSSSQEEPPFEEESHTFAPNPVSATKAPGKEWWETLLDTMKNDNHAVLMGSMSKGTHDLRGNNLTLTFPSRYIADSVEREKNYIKKLISQIMGFSIILEVIIKEPLIEKKSIQRDEKVELFLRIFQGTVIEDNKGVKP